MRSTFSEARASRLLFRLRGLRVPSYDLAGLDQLGLREVAADDGELLLGGVVGTRAQLLAGEIAQLLASEQPRLAVLAWNFRVVPLGNGDCELSTETRVRCERPWVPAVFLPYWALIRPFGGWIRRELLRLLRAQAEHADAATAQLQGAGSRVGRA